MIDLLTPPQTTWWARPSVQRVVMALAIALGLFNLLAGQAWSRVLAGVILAACLATQVVIERRQLWWRRHRETRALIRAQTEHGAYRTELIGLTAEVRLLRLSLTELTQVRDWLRGHSLLDVPDGAPPAVRDYCRAVIPPRPG